jgi:hypothetical protein
VSGAVIQLVTEESTNSTQLSDHGVEFVIQLLRGSADDIHQYLDQLSAALRTHAAEYRQ